tara:strand:+ start:740 stop:958 length:219 start_codon:yes stop_codon:yes gene_type:complete
MLYLSRKQGEAIVIDGTTVIRIEKIGKAQIKLAIDSKEQTTIYREELYKKIVSENKNALTSSLVLGACLNEK